MNTTGEFQAVWRFRVEPAHVPDFLAAYAPDGAWAELFRRSPAYLSTVLLRDAADACAFLTIDRWTSQSAYRAFRAEFAAEYARLDARCDKLTRSEELVFEGAAVPERHHIPAES